MAKRCKLWSPEQETELKKLYLKKLLYPKQIAQIMPEFTPRQISTKIEVLGLSDMRQAIREAIGTKLSKVVDAQVDSTAKAHARFIKEIENDTQVVAKKAMEMAKASGSARDLNSAVGAAAKAVQMFRQAAGIDSATPPGNTSIHFHSAHGNPFNPKRVDDPVEEPEEIDV